jgi:hypothetical protein
MTDPIKWFISILAGGAESRNECEMCRGNDERGKREGRGEGIE